jgi:hypothetical protein
MDMIVMDYQNQYKEHYSENGVEKDTRRIEKKQLWPVSSSWSS